MDYKTIMGYGKKKKKVVTEKKSKSITDNLKKQFGPLNEWSEKHNGPKRWTKDYNNDHRYDGLTEFEKSQINEGPAYEYGKDNNNIERAKSQLDKAMNGLAKTLKKNGHKDKAKYLTKKWDKYDEMIDDCLDDTLSDLL